MPGLFDSLQVRGVTLHNRVVMPPMIMRNADCEGRASDWHLVHYGTRSIGGAGLVLLEVTAVQRRARITEHDLGLWEDAQIGPLQRLTRFCAAQGAAIGVQLGHAGRKAHGEEPVGPSALAFDEDSRTPGAT